MSINANFYLFIVPYKWGTCGIFVAQVKIIKYAFQGTMRKFLPFLIWKELSKGYIIIGVVLRGKKYRQMSEVQIKTSEHQQMANHLIQTEHETYRKDGTSHHGLDGYLKESY